MVTVAISGLHGTGKSTAAKAMAEKFDLKYVSAGQVFRKMAEERDMSLSEFSSYVEDHPEIDKEIDKRTAYEAKNDNVLIDARLGAWMAEEADIRILLKAPLDVRVNRISERDGRPREEIKEETISREKSEKNRFKELYGIDVDDHSMFDLVLDTERFEKNEMIKLLESAVELISD